MNTQATEIWVPDFDLFNVASGMQDFPDAMADVGSDGAVNWRCGGRLKAICEYHGLAKIPFDHLGCQFIMGPWTRLGSGKVAYRLLNGVGFVVGDFKPTYNEFKILPELVNATEEGIGILSYIFYFERATNYYLANIVIPTTILTYVSFGTFLLDLRVGERLSFGMALTLVIVAQQIVSSGLLPVSDAYMWIDKYVGWSFYWVIFGLIESVAMGYFYFIREDCRGQHNQKPGDSQAPPNAEQHSVNNDDFDTPQDSNLINSQVPETNNDSQQAPPNKRGWMLTPRFVRNWEEKVALRRIDHICFFVATFSYAIFVIVMFSTVPTWGASVDPTYE